MDENEVRAWIVPPTPDDIEDLLLAQRAGVARMDAAIARLATQRPDWTRLAATDLPALVEAAAQEIEALRSAVEGLIEYYARWSDAVGGYSTGGLCVLQHAFRALGWTDPRPCPNARCDESGCMERGCYSWPTSDGRRRHTCAPHAKLGNMTNLSGANANETSEQQGPRRAH